MKAPDNQSLAGKPRLILIRASIMYHMVYTTYMPVQEPAISLWAVDIRGGVMTEPRTLHAIDYHVKHFNCYDLAFRSRDLRSLSTSFGALVRRVSSFIMSHHFTSPRHLGHDP